MPADPHSGALSASQRQVASLLGAHRAELVAFVEHRLHDLAAAEDVVQQAALKAMRHAAGLRDPAAGRAWLFRITRNALADELSRRHPQDVSVDAGSAEGNELLARAGHVTDPEAEDPTCRCVLKQAGELKTEYHQLLTEVVLGGRPITEVAAELGITANNATVRLHRARAALKQKLMDHCGTDSVRACLNCACDERRCCGDA